MLAENGQAAMLDVFLEQKGPAFNINMCNDEGEVYLPLYPSLSLSLSPSTSFSLVFSCLHFCTFMLHACN